MKETIEKQVSDAVLQEPLTMTLGGKEYTVAKPTVATIIEVSRLISTLPIAPFLEGKDEVLTYVLSYAKDCNAIGDIAATLILGKKGIITQEERTHSRFFGLIKEKELVTVDHRASLSKELLENASNEELLGLIREALGLQHLAFFFSIITSLNEANVLRRTKWTT